MKPFRSYSFRQYCKPKAPAAQEHVGPGPKMTSALWLHESQKTKLDMEGGKKSAGRGADGGLISRSREEYLAGLRSPLKYALGRRRNCHHRSPRPCSPRCNLTMGEGGRNAQGFPGSSRALVFSFAK